MANTRAPDSGGAADGGSVLIVDDERHIRAVLRSRLEDDGYRVVDEATDARSAIALAALHEPDLVVLDHHMAEGLGVDVIAGILQASGASTVVVYTANDTPSVRSEALAAGAAAVVDKAAGAEQLMQTLAGLRPHTG